MIAPPAALYIGLPQPCATRRGLACCNPPACLTTLIVLLNVRASLRRLYRSEVLPRADAERADSGRLVALWSRSAVRNRSARTGQGRIRYEVAYLRSRFDFGSLLQLRLRSGADGSSRRQHERRRADKACDIRP